MLYCSWVEFYCKRLVKILNEDRPRPIRLCFFEMSGSTIAYHRRPQIARASERARERLHAVTGALAVGATVDDHWRNAGHCGARHWTERDRASLWCRAGSGPPPMHPELLRDGRWRPGSAWSPTTISRAKSLMLRPSLPPKYGLHHVAVSR